MSGENNMNDNELKSLKSLTLILSVIVITSCTLTSFIGYVTARISTQQEAVDNGVAKWTVDNKGHLGFEWIKPVLIAASENNE
jgi:hypothetical protein